MRLISRTVVILSVVSLFADIASEMIYPVVPVYLKEIGFSVLLIGLLEGVAEFTSGISKGYFGKLSDEKGFRLPFIKAGYFFSAISKPMMAILVYPLWIFFARTLDRLERIKNCRKRCIAFATINQRNKSQRIWFSRAMDTVGAALGRSLP
jgi:MFS family permease